MLKEIKALKEKTEIRIVYNFVHCPQVSSCIFFVLLDFKTDVSVLYVAFFLVTHIMLLNGCCNLFKVLNRIIVFK